MVLQLMKQHCPTREKFRNAMTDIGLNSARAGVAHSMEEANQIQKGLGFPTIIRPSFTMGGSGGGIAYNRDEFEEIVARGLDMSPTTEVLLEESLLGWKEYGYTLDELRNEITGGATPASFEPSIDYVVTKIPRFTFEKFPKADARLTTQMKSVGEVMAIGRTFQESFQKALRGLETGIDGLDERLNLNADSPKDELRRELTEAGPERILYVADGFRFGQSAEELFEQTAIDPWFLDQIQELVEMEEALKGRVISDIDKDELFDLKRKGFSDRRLAKLLNTKEAEVSDYRRGIGVRPIYKRVDTCAAEFSTDTAYMYSSYDEECESAPSEKDKIMVLGGGPNRIGQGIEFDYCCVHDRIGCILSP